MSPRIESIAALVAALALPSAYAAPACTARSAATLTPLIELYTSEGCSSCPPADRWLSRFKSDPATVALAYHVDYWDRLGWKDRFASPAYTQRQARQQRSNGARFSYTPQVVIDGVDRPDWHGIAQAPTAAAGSSVVIDMHRVGDRVTARVHAGTAAPAQLAAYWAVTENDHTTTVKAGENHGASLRHDFVVRSVRDVPAWSATAAAPTELQLDIETPADPAHPRRINLVVLDARSGRPVQALMLGC